MTEARCYRRGRMCAIRRPHARPFCSLEVIDVRIWRTMLVAALAWLAAAAPGRCQAIAGSQVSGVVKDSSGGVLPGVEVTMTKTDTGTVRTVFTGGDGSYV